MKITDYETGRELRDVGLSLTMEEALELRSYLSRLLNEPGLNHAFLSEVSHGGLDKELSVRIDAAPAARPSFRRPLPLPRRRPVTAA